MSKPANVNTSSCVSASPSLLLSWRRCRVAKASPGEPSPLSVSASLGASIGASRRGGCRNPLSDKQLRTVCLLVRDQEVEGSNPFTPTFVSLAEIRTYDYLPTVGSAAFLERLYAFYAFAKCKGECRMPKLLTKPPKYTCHKASGQAVVKVGGKVRYLGPFNSAESKVRYQAVIAEWAAEQKCKPAAAVTESLPEADTTISELLAAYLRHAQEYYVKGGQITSQVHIVRTVARLWKEAFGGMLVRKIKPAHLKAVQNRMVTDGQSRCYVNKVTTASKSLFRWAVENDLAPAEVWQGLMAVRGLAKGRTAARETDPIGPVDDTVVDATLPYLPEVVADMVRLQRATGARPSEVCTIRPVDVNRTGEVWLYRPARHKTEHHDRGRVIAIGPRGQEILARYLLRPEQAHCFSPRESELRRHASRREARESPMTPSQAARKPKSSPRRSAKDRYTRDSYRRAVARAVEVANEERAKAGIDPMPHWHPNQLRHSLGTEVRQRFGLEAAQVVLGHSKADVTQVYAERDQRLAVEVARQVG